MHAQAADVVYWEATNYIAARFLYLPIENVTYPWQCSPESDLEPRLHRPDLLVTVHEWVYVWEQYGCVWVSVREKEKVG